jgi:hypothetical protein
MKYIYVIILALFFQGCSKSELATKSSVPEKPEVKQETIPVFTDIPDQNFEKALIERKLDTILDAKVRTVNILYIEQLFLDRAGITNMTGIQAFKNLKNLSVYQNYNLKTLDVTQNTKLTNLCISDCDISTIDISKNTELVEITFQNSSGPTTPYGTTKGLISIDLTKNKKLEKVYLWANRLTALDVSMCPNLVDLWIGAGEWVSNSDKGGNFIEYLDLSKNPKLNVLMADNNKLTYLNIKGTANNGLPRTCVTKNNPNLLEIKVTNKKRVDDHAYYLKSIGNIWYTKDSQTQYVE